MYGWVNVGAHISPPHRFPLRDVSHLLHLFRLPRTVLFRQSHDDVEVVDDGLDVCMLIQYELLPFPVGCEKTPQVVASLSNILDC